MITISKISDKQKWAEAVTAYRLRGLRTNFYAKAEDFFGEQLSEMHFDGGCYLFQEKEKQINLYFFLEKDAKPVPLPNFGKPLVLEQVAAAKNPPNPTEWKEIGFADYLQRKRLFLSAKKTVIEERAVSLAKEEEAEQILALMQRVFDPYTSALPTLEILRQDLREGRILAAREGERLLGFLRFERIKGSSFLWQIAVTEEGQGRGIGRGLVRDWLFQEKDAAKFQLWVREDNPPALKMYAALGFLPDGRIAPVMLKKEKEEK